MTQNTARETMSERKSRKCRREKYEERATRGEKMRQKKNYRKYSVAYEMQQQQQQQEKYNKRNSRPRVCLDFLMIFDSSTLLRPSCAVSYFIYCFSSSCCSSFIRLCSVFVSHRAFERVDRIFFGSYFSLQ